MTLNAIIFDLGGTLIDYANEFSSWPELETPGLTAAYAHLSQNGLALPDLERWRRVYFAHLPQRWEGATRGERNLRLVDVLKESLAQVGVTAVPADQLAQAAGAYENAICQTSCPLPGGKKLLAQLNADGLKIGLLSNTMFTGAAHMADLRRFGLDGYFDAMLFSADADKWKPQPEPYLHVAAELGVEPETAVFVGDSPAHDIVGARRAGMRAVHFRSHQRAGAAAVDGVRPDAVIYRLDELASVLQDIRFLIQS